MFLFLQWAWLGAELYWTRLSLVVSPVLVATHSSRLRVCSRWSSHCDVVRRFGIETRSSISMAYESQFGTLPRILVSSTGMIVVLQLLNVRRVGWKFTRWGWWVSWEGWPNLSRRRREKLSANLSTQFGGANRIHSLRTACRKCNIIIFKYNVSVWRKSI